MSFPWCANEFSRRGSDDLFGGSDCRIRRWSITLGLAINNMAHSLNFSYGSNMLAARLRERVPKAQFVGVGVLREHALKWHKVASDGSGKCDIALALGSESYVCGVIYRIPPAEKSALDRAEGLGYGYNEKSVNIEVGGSTLVASAYFATNTNPELLPFTWYRALVIAGAVEHGLPQEYISLLRNVPATQDTDSFRHSKYMALAGA